jgi:hypothetical protein
MERTNNLSLPPVFADRELAKANYDALEKEVETKVKGSRDGNASEAGRAP